MGFCGKLWWVLLTGGVVASVAVLSSSAASRSTAASATPNLELTKTADAATVQVGQHVGFRINLRNHAAVPDAGQIIIDSVRDPYWEPGVLGFTSNKLTS